MSLSEDSKKEVKEIVTEVLNSRRKARKDFRNAERRTSRDNATRKSQVVETPMEGSTNG
jgi:hypothetical protein